VIEIDLTPLSLQLTDWEIMRDWMQENNITWYACGNKKIGFDKESDAFIFTLRWM